MNKYLKYVLVAVTVWASTSNASAQYTLNGSATRDNCNCYTLTPDQLTKSGSVWNNNKIDLTQPFTFTFNVYLGCNDGSGADGIVFVLQPISTSIGSSGGGLGFQGISPSVGVTLDTWENTNNLDPAYDHLAIQINGDLNHNTANNVAGPIAISSISNNVEDCKWHFLKISWDPITKKYEVYFDGNLRLSLVKDFVADVFNGDSKVFWGFTGSTGGSTNLQQFCTTLSPNYYLLPDQKRCIGEPINFFDSSLSFAPIVKRYWNFGDNSPIDSVNVNPVHTYTSAGEYTVKLTLVGADGCTELQMQALTIGSKPVAAFTVDNACEGQTVSIVNSSSVAVGTINNWFWNYGSGTSTQKDPVISFTGSGSPTISLAVKTLQGCVSDTVFKTITVSEKPVLTMSFANSCINAAVNFTSSVTTSNIAFYKWDFGDGTSGAGNAPVHKYSKTGDYIVSLFAVTTGGCISDTIKNTINIYGTSASAGYDINAATLQPVQLQASGGLSYEWIPSTGLSDPFIANPIATLSQNQTYILRAFTPQGCETFDTLNITIYKGPDIYVPTAFSPNNDGINDQFKAVAVGINSFNFLKIYNRWGQLVFNTTDPSKGWDGKFKNIDQPAGVYMFITSGTDFNNQTITRKGTVTIIR